MKRLIINIIKWIVFIIIVIIHLSSVLQLLQGASTFFIIGVLMGAILWVSLTYYWLFKCKYKIIKGLYHKFSNWAASKKQHTNS